MDFNKLPSEPTSDYEKKAPDTWIDLHKASDHVVSLDRVQAARRALAAAELTQPVAERQEVAPSPEELIARQGVILLATRRRRAADSNGELSAAA